ncbi:hypothetical protein TNCV_2265871 [Trichonephila clavipes]|nr:hypothetical protein TNCV_2265871 [Trichonephila clavipes]
MKRNLFRGQDWKLCEAGRQNLVLLSATDCGIRHILQSEGGVHRSRTEAREREKKKKKKEKWTERQGKKKETKE